ncbi:hypothetical protein ACB092_04G052700 [Castanea dentata]
MEYVRVPSCLLIRDCLGMNEAFQLSLLKSTTFELISVMSHKSFLSLTPIASGIRSSKLSMERRRERFVTCISIIPQTDSFIKK